MPSIISGTEYIHNLLDQPERRRKLRRPTKIVHLDVDWIYNHKALVGCYNQLLGSIPSSKQRWNKTGNAPILKAIHATSCSAIIKCKLPKNSSSGIRRSWNLARHSNLLLAPILNTANSGETSNDDSLLIDIAFTLMKIVAAAENAENEPNEHLRLQKGDIIVIPLGLNYEANDINKGTWIDKVAKFPIIDDPMCRDLIKTLTYKHKICVILAAGNGSISLDEYKPKNNDPEYEARIYQNHGVHCGAILVGAAAIRKDKLRVKSRNSNHGSCIDIWGPNTPFGNDDLNIAQKPQNGELVSNVNEIPLPWQSSSSAAMFAAAMLANMQNLRMSYGLPPYEPVDARAHLRQWTMPLIIRKHIQSRYVNLIGWAEGIGLLNLTADEWDNLVANNNSHK